jgi:F-type H+-transporting ATPase subunit a
MSEPCFAQTGEQKETVEHHDNSPEEFDPSAYILDHIADSHEWHLWTTAGGRHVAIPLPVILWSPEKGLSLFSSARLAHGHSHENYMIAQEGELKGKIVMVDDQGAVIEGKLPLDLSVTKNIAAMMVASLILIWLFVSMARSYARQGVAAPGGLQGFLEPVVLFVRDDIALPNIGEHKYEKFMPYLLTVFFFILINNLMGLIPIVPGGANVTGNIAVTLVLALFTFFITQINGTPAYWGHIFNTPGVPFWLKPIMIAVEVIGMISKPFALMIRLFANITAGHIIVLSLVSLIFIFKSLLVAPVSIIFVLFMDCLELLVAFLQAYVFTLLSALFIGLAVQEHH